MCSDSKLSRLCRLDDDFLRPYTESGVVLVAQEREVLVTLSQVLRQVKLWTQALDSESGNGVAIGLDCESDCMCLTKIVTHLMVLLTVESQYVKHLACSVLVAVSEFLVDSGSNWEGFIRLLCVCMNLAITAAVSCSSSCSVDGADDLHSGSSRLILGLKPKLENADWSIAAAVVRVLRDIRKYLKSEDDHELVEVFFDSINSVFSTVPWNLLDEIHVGAKPDAQKGSRADAMFQRSLFLGNLIQFLCSMVEQSGSEEASGGSIDKHHPVFSTFITLVPQLFCWCLGEQAHCINFNKCISQYFRHKLLVLMIRLIFRTYPQQSVLVSWLQLVHDYFGELLRQPITPLEYQDDCLEGSPFLSSVSDAEVNSLSSRHLQRQAIFLFLRCSFGLISSKEGTNNKCACAIWNLCLTCDSKTELECCGRKKGLLELYSWLQGHLPTDISVDHEMLEKEKGAFQDSKGNTFFRVLDIFNPLSYDHQVLLDYLISKDTGISCAEYLLRCLRKVFDSWSLFVEFSMCRQATNRSSKRRKVQVRSCKGTQNGGKYFKEAKGCLISLKNSIESLHRKNLFPYNPNVLLNRLTRFQELCLEEKK
ncbi:hypothetical protein C1H46_033383 [Malus baccata]|uniref:Protein Lines C-terminal domain-containing protein n=1 Tax=Malus baccata TaxID=106549 RepID=A0A540L3M0_MALBA|nr:hypothetical protein C1H46_033383 [Malus baccata]